MDCRVAQRVCFCLFLFGLPTSALQAQPSAPDTESIPKIPDEPKTIDPAAAMPKPLAAAATHDFSDSSLREVVDWLQDEHEFVVLLDRKGLSGIGVSPAEPISDRLEDAPIYLLLDRLRSLGLAWYFEDEILHITSAEVAEERATTLPYNVGDLIDGGYDLDDLEDAITSTVAPNSWELVGGEGVLNSLADVMFVRQTDELHRKVQGMLTALRGHGRQTFVNDPVQHLRLRARLKENVSCDFLDTPLETAISQLAKSAQIDIRLDMPALRQARVREREPVTLKLTDRKLATVLQAVVLDLNLTWILRDGVLWITSYDEAEGLLKTAVYDVRDLCRDADESHALIRALTSQTEPASWEDVGGPGAIEFVRPGTVVISHQERIHSEVLNLLETYRSALRSSKRRKREEDAEKVTTVYYRMHTGVAASLEFLLPRLVRPESWKSATRETDEAPGEIILVSSAPELTGLKVIGETKGKPETAALLVDRSVLIIRQTRAAHDEIQEVIRRVQAGDTWEPSGGGMGGMGGFGGGFFDVPSDDL